MGGPFVQVQEISINKQCLDKHYSFKGDPIASINGLTSIFWTIDNLKNNLEYTWIHKIFEGEL